MTSSCPGRLRWLWHSAMVTAAPVVVGERRARLGVAAGRAAGALSRWSGRGGGSVIVGRVALAVEPGSLAWLARGRTVVLVSGTNGKTTTAHLLAAAVGVRGEVAHNASGSNMADGVVAALAARPRARWAVLEVDELHLSHVARAVAPAVIVLLNLTRDQLDRGSEVRATAATIGEVVRTHPSAVVIANADDPLTVWAARAAARPVWVAAGGAWRADARSCPQCAGPLEDPRCGDAGWACAGCGLTRPHPAWWWQERPGDVPLAHHPGHGPRSGPVAVRVGLPGRFNVSNAVMAVAAAAAVGVDPGDAADALSRVDEVAGRYLVTEVGVHRVRLLLMKNPAGWVEALDVLRRPRPILVVVNAREADGRDVSWLWDLAVEPIADRAVAVAGDRFADLGVRLSYAGIDHIAAPDPLVALAALPAGDVDVVANYTAFQALRTRLDDETAGTPTAPAGRSPAA